LKIETWQSRARISFSGTILFGLGFIGISVIGFYAGDFVVARPPAWTSASGPPPWLIHVSNALLFLAGLFIVCQWIILPAALGIALLILLLSISRHLPVFLHDWTNAYKALALFGGSLIVACQPSLLRQESKESWDVPPWKRDLVSGGIGFMVIFFLACGYAHFRFSDFVIQFIPDYIPFRPFWAAFCAICLLAAGIGFLVPSTRQMAAFLSGTMILGWFFLVHIPRIISNPQSPAEWMGLFESMGFSGILFVMSGLSLSTK
jgi:uncharacterized membrane protein